MNERVGRQKQPTDGGGANNCPFMCRGGVSKKQGGKGFLVTDETAIPSGLGNGILGNFLSHQTPYGNGNQAGNWV